MGDDARSAAELDDALQHLHALEQRNVQLLPTPQAMPAELSAVRNNMVKLMHAVAYILNIKHTVVRLAVALLDKSLMHGRWIFDAQLQSLAVFVLAVKYEDLCTSMFSLSHFTRHWTMQHKFLFPGNALTITAEHLRHAEAQLLLMLVPLNVATSNRFLSVFLVRHVHDTEAQNLAELLNDIELANNVLHFALPSMQAAASVLAALVILNKPRMDEAELDARYEMPPERELLLECVHKLLHVYYGNEPYEVHPSHSRHTDMRVQMDMDDLEKMLYTDETMEMPVDLRMGSVLALRSPRLSPELAAEFDDSPPWRISPLWRMDTMRN